MPCTRIGNTIFCTSPEGRLHVGNKYIMVSFHHFCGPTFYTDRAMNNLYDPVDENDPVWEVFAKWYAKGSFDAGIRKSPNHQKLE